MVTKTQTCREDREEFLPVLLEPYKDVRHVGGRIGAKDPKMFCFIGEGDFLSIKLHLRC